ncbi:cytochrome P450 [Aspergillus ellipticus CBS 707.79]|uniref:Cytochrome P450 n=1 Tax=Aspergillus ellipticus CBS 707.79 TaxID=1448320 RepID=A0A319DC66_9EURO|nr:cytochrome P450 [Aspergillus ellipticus CBS 707.79]
MDRVRQLLEHVSFQDWSWERSVTAVISLSLLLFLLASSLRKSEVVIDQTTGKELKRPPTLPYSLPILGHSIWFLRDGHQLMLAAAAYMGRLVPIRVAFPGFTNYIISGPESVLSYFRESRGLSTTSRSLIVVENAFGCPHHLVHLFQPQTSQNEGPSDIEHAIHRAVQTGLTGPALDTLSSRFQIYLRERIQEDLSSDIGSNWIEHPDFNGWVEKRVFEAAVRSLFGDYILTVNPTLADDFWHFNLYIGALFMGAPKWWNPAAYRAREKMVSNLKRWQDFCRECCDVNTIGEDLEWEPFYGSKFIRERQILLTRRGIMDETARAAENFAFMWATNSNSVPAAVWCALEILQDTTLKEKVISILPSLTAAVTPEDNTAPLIPNFSIPSLTSNPLLQSIYAETLRLRVAVIIVRQPSKPNFSFRGWHIKQDEVLSISTRTEALDSEIWSTGTTETPRPLDTFWAERFLVNPNDADSGPVRARKDRKRTDSEPYFSLDGLAGSWIPYGGGKSFCPGRHFAKREILATAAVVLGTFEIELLGGKERPDGNMRYFGFGTMPLDKKVAFRVRRRV